MNSVIKRNKKTLLAKIIEKTRTEQKPCLQENIPFDDIRTDADVSAIASRRNELRSEKHDSSDAIVSVNNITGGA